MKKRYTEEQIAFALRLRETRILRRRGPETATISEWNGRHWAASYQIQELPKTKERINPDTTFQNTF